MLDFRRYRSMDGDAALQTYIAGLPDPAPGRLAVRLALSQVSADFRRKHHLRMAIAVFEPLLESREGGLFPLETGDVVIVAAGLAESQWSRALLRLEGWLQEAELTQDGQRLVTWYDLSGNGRSELISSASSPSPISSTTATTTAEAAPPSRAIPLDARILGRLLDRLPELNPITVLRGQPVCAVIRDQAPEMAFLWARVDATVAADQLEPGIDLSSNRWLARSFTDALDEQLLTALARSPSPQPSALSLGLNALLSERFSAFNAALGHHPKPVLVLPKIDVFADTAGWLTASDIARAAGYRLSVGGLTRSALPMMDRSALGADLLWLAADSGLERADADDATRLGEAVRKAGTARVILTGVDRPGLREAGHNLGISLMSGLAVQPNQSA